MVCGGKTGLIKCSNCGHENPVQVYAKKNSVQEVKCMKCGEKLAEKKGEQ